MQEAKTHSDNNRRHSERDCRRLTTTQLWNADVPTSSNRTEVSVLCCYGKYMVASSRTLLSGNVLFLLLTDPMKAIPWKANRPWAVAESSHPPQWDPKMNYRGHKAPPTDLILSQVNSVHIVKTHFLKTKWYYCPMYFCVSKVVSFLRVMGSKWCVQVYYNSHKTTSELWLEFSLPVYT
jgi:hypothetical protein